ncbi:hypothetical protein P152DRAFT_271354 [Eremomyces bilateralis CBS 781.70]|uniref:HIG1 domain-containing protein n=1 Tax=Eremomyces bilateralis CBS 781.70 TaxID=1392243 RepID=A0A6G1G8K8_9PEZI|nr:uncharacterized protein P152DRAFT_271354 [Eremomyces bilateralis CBS 781.70]KAF1814435.1 hypothetical protein P152DRAFT_271354 [Eremomyces bilateralis CBS 781.70]
MKFRSPEVEAALQKETIRGLAYGGITGLGLGWAAVLTASRRYQLIRGLTIPMKCFLVSSSGTFGAIILADRLTRSFEASLNPNQYQSDKKGELARQTRAAQTWGERTKDYMAEHRYPIVFGSWVASMGIALGIVGRSPYLSTSQKLVQARVYAQGLTVAVLLASFGLEASDATQGKGRWGWQTVKVMEDGKVVEKRVHKERYEGEDRWMDMVETEQRREKAEEEERKRLQKAS